MSRRLHPEEPEMIDCEVCLSQIPADNGVNVESEDYVFHFCGIECYQKWKEEDGPVTTDAPARRRSSSA